jgi:RNA polymerase sigma factor (sigma-70 family)
MEPMDHVDDQTLLRRYADDRSQEAFVEFVGRHLNLVYRSALRQLQGDNHHAQDITQMVFVEVARNASSLSSHPRLAGWLFTTTRYLTAAILRKERRRQLREIEAFAMNTSQFEPSPENWEAIRPILDEVMLGLSGADREAVLLHYFEGWQFAKVATRLATTEDAARMRVSRALEKLRKALNRRGVGSSTAALAIMLTAESGVAAPAALLDMAAAIPAGIAYSGKSSLGILHLMNTSKLAVSFAVGIGLLVAGAGIYCAATVRPVPSIQLAELPSVESKRKYSSSPFVRSSVGAQIARTGSVERSVISHSYRVVFDGIDLSDDEKERVSVLLMEKEQIAADLKRHLAAQASRSVDAINAQIESANKSVAGLYEQIRLVLGDTRFGQFRSLENSIPATTTLTALDQVLSGDGQPLTDQESQQLLNLLDPPHPAIGSSDSIQLTGLSRPNGDGFLGTVELRSHQGVSISPQILLDASTFLSPLKIDALKAVKNMWMKQATK